MDLKPGMIVIQQGDPHSKWNKLIRFFTNSWWVHGFVVVSGEDGVEARLPSITRLNSPSVVRLTIADRLKKIKDYGGDVVIMDLPGITDQQRQMVASAAESFIGYRYAWLNCILFAVRKVWFESKRKELVCSFLLARAFSKGIGVNIFPPEELNKLPTSMNNRRQNLEDGYCTPDEIFRYSSLEEVDRIKP